MGQNEPGDHMKKLGLKNVPHKQKKIEPTSGQKVGCKM
jgi:hypothetical protein